MSICGNVTDLFDWQSSSSTQGALQIQVFYKYSDNRQMETENREK